MIDFKSDFINEVIALQLKVLLEVWPTGGFVILFCVVRRCSYKRFQNEAVSWNMRVGLFLRFWQKCDFYRVVRGGGLGSDNASLGCFLDPLLNYISI